ncbi:hypothetical protein ANCCAN_03825 [Ancylostoma caninum]|uniref:NET domain-containing protein n=1 Tax=Ancylostoma caninum TaxID=29170 RepID=A0A368H421_ANCCA|nr:hypothetical protein ANCCAN_03825 [Ancylostoma caninum]
MSEKGVYGHLPILKEEPAGNIEPNSESVQVSGLTAHVALPDASSEHSDGGEDEPPSLSPQHVPTDENTCDAELGYIKTEPEYCWSPSYVMEQDYCCDHESCVIIKTENPSIPPSPSFEVASGEHDLDGIVKTEVAEVVTKYDDSDEELSYVSLISTCRDNSAMDDVSIKTDPYLFDNSSVKSESAEHIEEQPSVGSHSIPDGCFPEDITLGAEEVVAALPSSRGRKGKKRKSKARSKQVKASASFTRQPRKRKPHNDSFVSSVNVDLLPRRSSNRLRRKQVEQVIDYSTLPPKFTGPLLPSMHFCHYVMEQLMSAKYEPINWLIDLATVKKKLDYRQYEDADEFAAEIRSICMNPLDDSLADDSLSLLHSFEQLWLYMPLDPELPLIPEDSEGMDELELKYFAMLATLINNKKKCQFYGNQLSLNLQRVNDMSEAQRAAGQQDNALPVIPPYMKKEMDALAAKLQPYTSIPIDVLMESDLLHSPDRLLSAIAPVAPELMEMLRGKIVEQTEKSSSEHTAKDDQLDPNLEEPLTTEEKEQLVKDIEKLSDDDKITVLGIIANDDDVAVRFDEEDVHIELTNAKPSTFRKVVDCITALMQRQLSCQVPEEDHVKTSDVEHCGGAKSKANTGYKRKRTSSKSTSGRKKAQPSKRRAIDIEARKRELVEGIKKLGGTGTTRPIKKQVPYVEPRSRVRTSYYVCRSSSSSSSESTATSKSWKSGTKSWESGSSSETEAE